MIFSENETFVSQSIDNRKTIKGYAEIFRHGRVFRLLYLRYFEAKLICSFFGYKSASLTDLSENQNSNKMSVMIKYINFVKTIDCPQNATKISNCEIVEIE